MGEEEAGEGGVKQTRSRTRHGRRCKKGLTGENGGWKAGLGVWRGGREEML